MYGESAGKKVFQMETGFLLAKLVETRMSGVE